MPGFNGTGPLGAGPMTGAGCGWCATDDPATVGRLTRSGVGSGRGRRRVALRDTGARRGAGIGRSAGTRGRGRWMR
ncbi:MAG: DUF5320 domain-containing protein [Coriobacteriia bacterium]|nr:DUF5320 domain-containing protein [Coriobacteriia bacterium]